MPRCWRRSCASQQRRKEYYFGYRSQRRKKRYPCGRLWLLLGGILVLSTSASTNVEENVAASPKYSPSPIAETVPMMEEQQQQQPSPADPTQQQQQQLILCTTDGNLYSLDAWSGEFCGQTQTDPLITRSSDEVEVSVEPGIDGRLYLHDRESSRLEELPLTMQSLLDDPQELCSRDDEEDAEKKTCGVLHATVETSLLAMDTKGKLLWTKQQHRDPVSGAAENTSHENAATPLLLQRKDIHVHHVSSLTGQEQWNVSWGHWLAVEFSGGGDRDEQPDAAADGIDLLLPGHKNDRRETLHAAYPHGATQQYTGLPAVIFANQARTLLAVDPVSMQILWKMDTPSMVAEVFGIQSGRWKNVEVLQEEGLLPDSSRSMSDSSSDDSGQLMLPLPSSTARLGGVDEETSIVLSYYQRQDDSQQPRLPYITLRQQHARELGAPPPSPPVCRPGDTTSNSFCPNLMMRTLLQLPSPTSSSSSSSSLPTASVRADGLLLSWQLVAGMFIAFLLLLLLGFVGYRYKKQQWLTRGKEAAEAAASLSQDGVPAGVSATRGGGGGFDSSGGSSGGDNNNNDQQQGRLLLLRSQSLPHDLGQQHQSSETLVDRSLNHQHTDPVVLPDSATSTTNPPLNPPPPPLPHPKPAVIAAQTSTGSIPLIQYSRYASEFVEAKALGRGGFGTVFQSRNVLDGRDYAIKKVIIHGSKSSVFQQRLDRVLREVKILAVLDHPHIVRYYTAWLEMLQDDDKSVTEPKRSPAAETEGGDGDTSFSSKCYSSSLITAESSSHWNQTRPCMSPSVNRRTVNWKDQQQEHKQKQQRTTRQLLDEEQSELRRRPPSFGSDCGFIFEASREDEDGSSTTDAGAGAGDDSAVNTGRQPTSAYSVFEQEEESTIDLFDRSAATSADSTDNAGTRYPVFVPEEESTIDLFDGSTAPTDVPEDAGGRYPVFVQEEESTIDLFDRSGEEQSISIVFQPEQEPTLDLFDRSGIETNTTKTSGQAENPLSSQNAQTPTRARKQDTGGSQAVAPASSPLVRRHTLYIQMQLCTQKTVAEFLKNEAARAMDSNASGIDIPGALCLFLQIAKAVEHVHAMGLIHRDLKPQNCFMDEFGNVKVGDFGLSRESSSNDSTGNGKDESATADLEKMDSGSRHAGEDDHTAGVGTRSYASPEQMSGSDYDSSTDVFSLGIMLFELCYPMYTGMERTICLTQLRQSTFPGDWEAKVGCAFPSLKGLIESMVSVNPRSRPTAGDVAKDIQSIVSEYTLVSLDDSIQHGRHAANSEGSGISVSKASGNLVLLRVEGEHRDNAIGETLQALHAFVATRSDKKLEVVQYGLRTSSATGKAAVCIMEFAVLYPGPGYDLVQALEALPTVFTVRQVRTRASSGGGASNTS